MAGMFLFKAVVVLAVVFLLSPVSAFFGPAVEVSKLRVSIVVIVHDPGHPLENFVFSFL